MRGCNLIIHTEESFSVTGLMHCEIRKTYSIILEQLHP